MPLDQENTITSKRPGRRVQSKHFSEYVLDDLIADHGYFATESYDSIEQAARQLLLEPVRVDQVRIIGVNGPTCAGKTTFTSTLMHQLTARNVPVVHVGFDWFLYDRPKRARLVDDIAKGRKTIPQVTRAAWDVRRYSDLLHQLKNSEPAAGNKIVLSGLYDRVYGTQTDAKELVVPFGGYVIVEGVGVLDAGDTDLIDARICLDVSDDDILIDRAIARECEKPPPERLSEGFLRRRFEVMDRYHMRYLRKTSRGHNHIIMDVSDFNNIKTYSRLHA